MPSRRIPAYFSHSYRSSDREINEFFWRLMHERGFSLSVDPRSDTLSVPYLEIMMKRSACFAAVVTLRTDKRGDRCSPFILYEYGLAIQAQKPRVVFVEKGVSGRYFPSRGGVCIFDRTQLEDDKQVFERKIKALFRKSRPYRRDALQLRGTVGIVLDSGAPARAVYTDAVRDAIHQCLRDEGFSFEEVEPRFLQNFEIAIHLDRFDFLVMDVGPDLTPSWVFPYVQGRFLPTIKLFHLADDQAASIDVLPPLAAGQLLRTSGPDQNSLIFWREEDDLLVQLRKQLNKLDSERTELVELEEGHRYFRSLGRTQAKVFISNASEVNEFAKQLSARLRLENITHFQYKTQNTIPLGSSWERELADEVAGSQVFIALITKGYWDSKWCLQENQAAVKLHEQGLIKLIPYFLEDGPGPAQPSQGRVLYGRAPHEQIRTIIEDLDNLLKSDEPRIISAKRAARAIDVAVITVLPEEYDAVLAELDRHDRDPGSKEMPNLFAWELGEIAVPGNDRPYRVVVALAGHAGNLPGASATQETIERWSPRYVLLVGIAGGLATEGLNKGDVVISTMICGYEYGKLAQTFIPRADFAVPADAPLVRSALAFGIKQENFARLIKQRPPVPGVRSRVVAGLVASGEKVVDDVTNEYFNQVLKQWPKLQAIEMEGLGAASAVHAAREKGRNVGFLMIRGISDMPRHNRPEVGGEGYAAQTKERDTWKRYAAAAAAAFAVQLIRQSWPLPPA
jgi:nucleoside phosphorylase